MVSGLTPERSSAAFAATAPRSMAETEARAPPGSPSPRLPPIHSAIGVRAPVRITMSGMPLLDKELLLAFEDPVEISPLASYGMRPGLSAVWMHGTSEGIKCRSAPAGRHPPIAPRRHASLRRP